jgi:transcription antitermination factor NusG
MAGTKQKWYAVYTKPRCEKKVYGRMLDYGFEAYCPLNKVKKKWSDRIKWVEEPLFKSYVFVRMAEEQQTKIRLVGGVVNFVYWLGKPAIVKDRDIEIIRKFLNDYEEIRAEPLELEKGAKVKIRQGALMDKEGKVVKVLNNKVRVVIESIGYSLVAVVKKSNVTIARKH